MNQEWWLKHILYQNLDACEFWYEQALKNPAKAKFFFARAKEYNLCAQAVNAQMQFSLDANLYHHITSIIYQKINEKWIN